MENTADRNYLNYLYKSHYAMLFNLAASILLDKTDAGDVVTNAMLSLFSKVPFLRALEEKERAGYLRATVRNAAFKYYNAQTRRNLTEMPLLDGALFSLPGSTGEDPADLLLKNDEFCQVREAIATLGVQDRRLLHLKYAVRLTAREIAEITDAPNEAAVQMRLSRARRKVLRYLEDRGWEHIKEWSEDFTGSGVKYLNKGYYVERGYSELSYLG